MKIKHMLAVTALILIFAVTACTQYVFEFPTDKEITTVEDLVKFMQKHEKDSAKVNLTIDPDNSYLPITINGDKTITGKITIKEDSPFPFPFSSVTTYATKAGATNLFEIADNASLSVTNFEASVTSNAADSINAIIYVDGGEFNADSFTSSKSVTGLSIGKNATASKISITDSNIGNIAIDSSNPHSSAIYDEIEAGNSTDAEISTGFDVTTAKEFENALKQFGRVRLTDNIIIKESKFSFPKINETTYDINLNDYKLSFITDESIIVPQNKEVLFSNGTLETTINNPTNGTATSNIGANENGTITLNQVTYTAGQSGIYPMANECEVNVINSNITAKGAYGVSTNASAPVAQGIKINIENSVIETLDADSAGVVFNVPGEISIVNSKIYGGKQSVIIRGGDAIIDNCELVSRATYQGTINPIDDDVVWGSGNNIPYSTLVIGNKSTNSYSYETNCELVNTTIAMEKNIKDTFLVYVYSSQNYNVTFSSAQYADRFGNDAKFYAGPQGSGSEHTIITDESIF